MPLDSKKNTFSVILSHVGMITKIYTNLYAGYTTGYQEADNVSDMLEIEIFANDTSYYDFWVIPSDYVDPADPENGPYLRTGYYTFSIYTPDSVENRPEVALLVYRHWSD